MSDYLEIVMFALIPIDFNLCLRHKPMLGDNEGEEVRRCFLCVCQTRWWCRTYSGVGRRQPWWADQLQQEKQAGARCEEEEEETEVAAVWSWSTVCCVGANTNAAKSYSFTSHWITLPVSHMLTQALIYAELILDV